MGSPGARSRVEVGPFGLMRTEVTVDQYAECMLAGRCELPGDRGVCNWGKAYRGGHPVNCVSRKDASDYCTWKGGRLPSEAEWEFAARSGGGEQVYPWGFEPATCGRAVMNDPGKEGAGCGSGGTRLVCSNRWGNTLQGLCDMAGNVFEWVDESSGGRRNLRGGGWNNGPSELRATRRSWDDPEGRYYNVGFRCARDTEDFSLYSSLAPEYNEQLPELPAPPAIPSRDCPAKTEVHGSLPPDDFEVYCAWKSAQGRLVKHGLYTGYYDNGKKASEGEYRQGLREGNWIFWYDSGRVRLEACYREDRKHGRWVFRNRKGEQVRVIEYVGDHEVGR